MFADIYLIFDYKISDKRIYLTFAYYLPPSSIPSVLRFLVAMSMGVEFSKYLIAPCGSFTKIARSEDGRVLYSLHTDESFSLFPRRSFNLALKAFLHCLGDHRRCPRHEGSSGRTFFVGQLRCRVPWGSRGVPHLPVRGRSFPFENNGASYPVVLLAWSDVWHPVPWALSIYIYIMLTKVHFHSHIPIPSHKFCRRYIQ